jgi:hypothetical protein
VGRVAAIRRHVMVSIPVADLMPGMRMAYDLRDSGGRLLLAARRPLTEVVIRALAARGVTELPLRHADVLPMGVRGEEGPKRSWLMADSSRRGESAPSGRDGASEGEGDDREPVETELQAREGARVRAALRRSAEGVIAHRSARWKRLPMRVRFGAWEEAAAPDAMEAFGEQETLWSAERVSLVGRMFDRLARGEMVGAGTAHALVEEMVELGMRGPEGLLRTTIEGMRGTDMPPTAMLAAHAYATACVCVAIAARLGWPGERMRAAGLAGLLADCGLALLPWDVRNLPRELTDVEQNALRRHPAYSAAMLEMLRPGSAEESIPEEVQLAAYQHHEREDGSGYPTGVRAEGIHDLARLVGVADVFVGVANARADRPALEPSGALAEVARQANGGVLAIVPARALAELMVGASMRGPAVSVTARRGGMSMAA